MVEYPQPSRTRRSAPPAFHTPPPATQVWTSPTAADLAAIWARLRHWPEQPFSAHQAALEVPPPLPLSV